MPHALLDGLSLLDGTGHAIIVAILAALALGIGATVLIHVRYAGMQLALRRHQDPAEPIDHPVLDRIVNEARDAARRSREVGCQAVVEQGFQSELRGLLVGERFVRGATGLVIILGLVGTFYGLTLSIGKLVGLVSGEPAAAADVTHAVTSGLTQSLSGMSVAFSTSLVGIVAAIVLTVLGMFANVTDRRTAVMVQVETHVDRLLAAEAPVAPDAFAALERSVSQLDGAVARFDAALQAFATTTRDFREFNLHLKDNVQRMSLSFGDLSETLKTHLGAVKADG